LSDREFRHTNLRRQNKHAMLLADATMNNVE